MTKVSRAIEKGETLGFMKVLVNEESKEILGASILEQRVMKRSIAFLSQCMPGSLLRCSSVRCTFILRPLNSSQRYLGT